jgi:uncharacterized protein
MARKIFVNLPVRNLERSIEFYTRLGFSFNPKLTDETATCMIVADDINVMLLTEAKFKSFTPKAITNSRESTEVLLAISCENREQVDDMTQKAIASGGKPVRDPEDHGFMYGHSFQDLDGHIWEPFYMDPELLSS